MTKFFDGAFGTYYLSKTDDYEPCERANITRKKVVLDIHREYIAAGADGIKTNTFSANALSFEDENELKEIIEQGYLLASNAAKGTAVQVFADIGNINAESGLAEKYIQIAEMFLKLGAKNFLFETLSGFDEIVPALALIKAKVKESLTIASFAVSRDGFTQSGYHYRMLLEKALKHPLVDWIGLNCVCGPAHVLSLVKSLGAVRKPLVIMPNAGYPASVNGRIVYRDNTDYFAQKLLAIKQAGADVLGGCCGTTPQHIAAAIKLIRSESTPPPTPKRAVTSYPMADSGKRLKRKPIAVELDPPLDSDGAYILEAVERLKACGVSMITLADSPMARTRADSFLTAAWVKRETGIEVLPHLTCRDKNHIAIKGSLLGARFFGINKVLAITGDPVVNAEHYRHPGVFNFNAKELIKFIKGLNEEIFIEDPFSIGAALNVNATHFDVELRRCQEKVENGAAFLFSQPLFSDKSVDNFIKARQQLSSGLYAGILPIVSYKNAVFLNNEVVGIDIPPEIIDRLKGKKSATVLSLSLAFCRSLIERVYDYTEGFYLMTPMKRVDWICDLIERTFED